MNDKKVFSDEYQPGSETKADAAPIPIKTVLQDQIELETKRYGVKKPKLETKRYGMAKPKRIVIRVKTIHD